MATDPKLSRRNLMGAFGLAAAAALAGCSAEKIPGQALPGRSEQERIEPTSLNKDARLSAEFARQYPDFALAFENAASKFPAVPKQSAAVMLAVWAETQTGLQVSPPNSEGTLGLFAFNESYIGSELFTEIGLITPEDALDVQTSANAAATLMNMRAGCRSADLRTISRATFSVLPERDLANYAELVDRGFVVGRTALEAGSITTGSLC